MSSRTQVERRPEKYQAMGSKALHKRDQLSRQLQKLEHNIEEAIYERKKERQLGMLEYLSPKEKLGIFLEWHRELHVLHSSLGRSVGTLRHMGGSGRDLQVLKQLEENIGDLVEQSEPPSALARQRLEEMEEERCIIEEYVPRTGMPHSLRSVAVCGSSTIDEQVEGILAEAENIRRISIESSLRLKVEMEVLRAKSIDMTKNLVALNKIIESRKRELVHMQKSRNRDRRVDCWDRPY